MGFWMISLAQRRAEVPHKSNGVCIELYGMELLANHLPRKTHEEFQSWGGEKGRRVLLVLTWASSLAIMLKDSCINFESYLYD